MAPPKELTSEQRDLWDAMNMDTAPKIEGDMSWDQAMAFAVSSFRYACALDGLPKPSPEVIRSGFRPR